ncbi:MAG: branched-chain amino acid transport system II carrier protein [Mediterraneibacter gnavus]
MSLAVRPYLSESNVWWVSLLVTGMFSSGLTYYLSGNPKKVVNVIGKYLTPILLICIVLIFLACVFMEKSPNSSGSVWKRRSSAGSIQRDSVLPGND